MTRSAVREQSEASQQPKTLFWMRSQLNFVRVMEFPDDPTTSGPLAGCTALMLGEKGNIHSILNPDITADTSNLYWSNMALIAGLADEGAIGILGLAAGTVARTINHYWPERKMHGWEIDAVVVEAGRRHMGMQALEDSGALVCHIGDALAPEATIGGGFAGIVVDLFADGALLSCLNEESAWEDIRAKLKPGGVIVTNLVPGPAAEAFLRAFSDEEVYVKSKQGNWLAVAGADPRKPRDLPRGMQATASEWHPVGDSLTTHG